MEDVPIKVLHPQTLLIVKLGSNITTMRLKHTTKGGPSKETANY